MSSLRSSSALPVPLLGLGGALLLPAFLGTTLLALPGSEPDPGAATDELGDPHAELLAQELYPSARECAQCHAAIYDEWKSSAHAYSAISPMFHRFEQSINELASGTVNAFCVRCHIPVGTAMGELRHEPLTERAPVSREGVTCIACHRVEESYGRVNGERRIVPGPITDPVYGIAGGPNLDEVLENPDLYDVDAGGRGRGTDIHSEARVHGQLGKSEFCASCHQVAVHPGIKLEVVWDQYRASPSWEDGTTCQDCHMGLEEGVKVADGDDNYPKAYRAVVNNEPIGEMERHGDHAFVGPGYSIAHPGVFPHRLKDEFSFETWLTFDWRAPWGEAEWEAGPGPAGTEFPEEWSDPQDRIAARLIVDDQLAILEARMARRANVMNNGSKIDGPFFDDEPRVGDDLSFTYEVRNINPGHNLPSGSLGAQPQVWLNVALVGPDGRNLWESGWVDSIGDVGDLHSKDVLSGAKDHDDQLFNLQSKFLTTNLKGTDREMYLPVPFDGDQLPFIRPAGVPSTVLNHPPFIRMEQRSIPPLGMKEASYTVPGELLSEPGTYRLSVRLRSRAEPIYFMEFVGATEDMKRDMNRRMVDIHPYSVEFEVR